MARPNKEGLDYFPLDVDIDQDDKVALIEAKHGIEGFAVIIKLFMKIYKSGYFYKWTEKEQLLLSSRINVNINSLNEIVNDCLEWELFSKTAFKTHGILTSVGIQSRYFQAIGRRKELVLNKDYLLVDPQKHLGNSKITLIFINSNVNGINVDINSVNESNNSQSKEKESKEKNIDDDKMGQPNHVTEYEKFFGPYPMGIFKEQMDYWLFESQFEEPEAIICETIKRIKLENPRNPSKYLQTALSNLHNLGLFTLSAVKEYNDKFDKKTKKKSPQQLPKTRPAHWPDQKPFTEEEQRELDEMEKEFPF